MAQIRPDTQSGSTKDLNKTSLTKEKERVRDFYPTVVKEVFTFQYLVL